MTYRPIVPSIRTGEGDGDSLRDAFREALSHWAAGVCVLAVRDEDEVLALTVSAFASVSLDPPLVLVCVSEHAGLLPSLLETGRFVVNLLGEDARAAAVGFAQGLPAPRGTFPEDGDPVLRGALASLVCAVDAAHPRGA
ncbi:MAG TPA: flavin reductase family protein, partial [Longimicrobium sp.]|nr:flavin reductase family protein [Longimicrobium sp.]